jgi:hypothetical protein
MGKKSMDRNPKLVESIELLISRLQAAVDALKKADALVSAVEEGSLSTEDKSEGKKNGLTPKEKRSASMKRAWAKRKKEGEV